MKILLLNPPRQNPISGEIEENLAEALNVYPPLGLAYLKAVLEEQTDHEVILVDLQFAGMGQADVAGTVRLHEPDLVGITVLTHNLLDVKETLATVKRIRPRAVCCLGGPHIDVFPELSLSLNGADLAMRGECEVTFPRLLRVLEENGLDPHSEKLFDIEQLVWKDENGIVTVNEQIRLPVDLDSLPFPAAIFDSRYHGPLAAEPVATILSSRGCPYRCVFCSTPHVRYRARSPENIIAELRQYRDRGVKSFYFVDDVFNITAGRVENFSQALLESSLKVKWSFRARVDALSGRMLLMARRAGAVRIQLGVETSTDEGLMLIGKGCSIKQVENAFRTIRSSGIMSVAYFILGCPHEKHPRDLEHTIDFACALEADYAVFNAMAIFPGTRLHDLAVKYGVIGKDTWIDFAGDPRPGFQIPLWTRYFTAVKLKATLKNAYRRFYYRPQVIFRELKRINGLEDLLHKARMALKL